MRPPEKRSVRGFKKEEGQQFNTLFGDSRSLTHKTKHKFFYFFKLIATALIVGKNADPFRLPTKVDYPGYPFKR